MRVYKVNRRYVRGDQRFGDVCYRETVSPWIAAWCGSDSVIYTFPDYSITTWVSGPLPDLTVALWSAAAGGRALLGIHEPGGTRRLFFPTRMMFPFPPGVR